jgi:uncharacterized membrane protein
VTSATLLTAAAAFLGSAVESVEALTIVLAVGLTRGWRAPLYGTAGALGILAVLVVTLGNLIVSTVPEQALKLGIGGLVLLFGMRWLHKAVLRSAGVIAMHDESQEFGETVEGLRGSRGRGALDWVGFSVAFKGVFLEGLEVAFIVFAAGSSSHNLPLASAAGVAAMIAVAAAGVLVRHPLAEVPENTLKTAVGLLLSTLGTFWFGEGLGVHWPYDLGSALVILCFYWLSSRLAVLSARRSFQAPA